MYPEDWGRCHSIVVVLGAGSYGNRKQLCISGFLILTSWKGGTWNELNRTKVYSISMKLNSAKVGSPLYLNSSHVVRVKPLHRRWRESIRTTLMITRSLLSLDNMTPEESDLKRSKVGSSPTTSKR